MTQVKAEQGIPFTRILPGPVPKYPWRTMEVGESFATDNSSHFASASTNSKLLAPKKFKAGQHKGQNRIWRVE